MKVLRTFRRVFSALILSTILTLSSFCGMAAAEEGDTYRMRITPAKAEIGELTPGKAYSGELKVQNAGTKEFDYKAVAASYTVNTADNKYTPDFETDSNYSYMAKWLTITPETGTVAPGEEAIVHYSIKVPADAPSGGQYAAILIQMVNSDADSESSNVEVAKQIGFVIYSQIEGNTIKSAKISDNKIPTISFNPTITASSVVENTGNVHAEANYVLQVFGLFGDEEVYTNEENPTTATVLPDTSRFNTQIWEGAPALGIFRVKQTVSILDQESVTEKIVFLCPIWFLFIILLIIFAAVFWIVNRVRTRNK